MATTIKGKALLVVDAGVNTTGKRTYSVEPFVQSASGAEHEAACQEIMMCDGHVYEPPSQCRKMKPGDRWRLAVSYEVTFTKCYDRYSGSYEWDVQVDFLRAKTLKKQPWSDKRHGRYMAKEVRAKLKAITQN